ncbi:MAG: type II secretion system minor pseudopilin GspK [Parvularculaceae bacterium]|nr:type II secretion system minor pseudopilin GspK [Parvularculaceae bacterium]
MSASRKSQASSRGAALVVVLLLAATLSFVMLGVTQIVSAGVHRSYNERLRTEMIWRAFSAEQVASAIMKELTATPAAGKPAAYFGLFQKPVTIDLPEGRVAIRFADAGRCFNLNSLVKVNNGAAAADPLAVEEFVSLANALGLSAGEANAIAEVVIDWIDEDATQSPQGAEDGFYTALPTPFRTGGALLASKTELRAMDGVTREKFGLLAPFVCTPPLTTPSVINLNTASERDLPLLAALVQGEVNVNALRDALSQRPPGGFAAETDFWDAAGIAPPAGRTGVLPSMVEARALLTLGDQQMEAQMIFLTPEDGAPRLISRAFGAVE